MLHYNSWQQKKMTQNKVTNKMKAFWGWITGKNEILCEFLKNKGRKNR